MEAAPVVGIDVSKKKLDVALLVNGKIKSKVIENTADGHKALLEWLGKAKVSLSHVHVWRGQPRLYQRFRLRREHPK